MTNLTISLDEAIVKKARIKAIQEGTSLSAKVREYLASYAQTDAPTRPAVMPKLPVVGQGGLRPGINPSSNRAMLDAMEDDEIHS